MKRDARHVVAVPVDVALAYTAERGWHVLSAPPTWWLQEQEGRLASDVLPVVAIGASSRRRVRLTAEQRRERARNAAAARWAGLDADARIRATAAARAAQVGLRTPEERREQAQRAGRASGAARRGRVA